MNPNEPTNVPLAIWHPSPHEVAFGPLLHSGSAVLVRWVDVAAQALFARFCNRPAWFVADWERARTWAYPDTFDAQHQLNVNGQDIRFARTMPRSAQLFAEMMRSHDVGWDAIAVMDGTFLVAQIEELIRPWQQAVNERSSLLCPDGDVMFTSGDGLVLRWANAHQTASAMQAAVLTVPGVSEVQFDP